MTPADQAAIQAELVAAMEAEKAEGVRAPCQNCGEWRQWFAF